MRADGQASCAAILAIGGRTCESMLVVPVTMTGGTLRILPRRDRVMVKKRELLDSKSQKPLQTRNKALLSLDGGGLRGILTGM